MYYAVAWVILLIAFGVLEAMTASMVSIWFCIGAVAGLISAACGATLGMQIGLFAVVSLLCMALLRPFVKKVIRPSNEKTNADRVIGAEAIVTESINNIQAKGQVRVQGQGWTARSEQDGIELAEGTQVRVLRIEGVKLIVRADEVPDLAQVERK